MKTFKTRTHGQWRPLKLGEPGEVEDGEFLLGFPINDYFFKYVIPGEEEDPTGAAKTVWTRVVRADVEIHYVVDMVAQFMAKKQDIQGAIDAYNNWDLLITFKGQPLRGNEILQDFEEKSMLLPTRVEDFPDTHLPDYLKDHQGHPWQCQRCGRAANKRNNLTRHKCSGGKQHKFLFAAV